MFKWRYFFEISFVFTAIEITEGSGARVFPKYMKLLEGDNIDFTCVSASKVSWKFNGKPLNKFSFKSDSNSTLYHMKIKSAVLSDSGAYTCRGTDVLRKNVFHESAKLIVVKEDDDPYENIYPKYATAHVGDTVKILCLTRNNMHWIYQGDMGKSEGDGIMCTSYYCVFVIESVTLHDRGFIHCYGTDLDTKEKFHDWAKITVYAKSQDFIIPKYQRVFVGDPAHFECKTPLANSLRHSKGYDQGGTKALTTSYQSSSNSQHYDINSTQLHHRGIYQCNITHSHRPFVEWAVLDVVTGTDDTFPRLYPEYQIVNVNMDAQFICISSQAVVWFFENEEVMDGLMTQHKFTAYRLKIFTVQKHNEGYYSCRGKSIDTGEDFTVFGRLIVREKFYGYVSPMYTRKPEGDTVKIYCDSSFPVRWNFRNKLPLRNERKYITNTSKYVIEIESVKKWHTGIYTCEGKTQILKRKFKQWSFLQVFEINGTDRRFNVHPNVQHVEVGETAYFLCISLTNVHWSFDGGDLLPEMIVHHPNRQLYILEIALVEIKHRGLYTCRGIEYLTKLTFEQSGVLVVTSNGSAVFKVHPSELVVFEGEWAEFSCSSDSPAYWTLSHRQLPEDVVTYQRNDKTNILRINVTNKHHIGYYQCHGNDENNKFFTEHVMLEVIDPHLVMQYKVKPIILRVYEGGSAEFHCESSSPVYWDYNGADATTKWVKKTNTYKLTIKNVGLHHSRLYTCEGTSLSTGKYFNAWASLEVFPKPLQEEPNDSIHRSIADILQQRHKMKESIQLTSGTSIKHWCVLEQLIIQLLQYVAIALAI